MSKNYQNDVGTLLRVDVGADITDATTTTLYVTKPDGETVEWAGSVSDCNKEIWYTIQAGDWDQAGEYLLQAFVTTPAWSGRGDTVAFQIYEAFN